MTQNYECKSVFFVCREVAGVTLCLHAFRVGEDLQVNLLGGAGHIGAVAVAVPSAQGQAEEGGCAVTVVKVPGHREDELARSIAQQLSKEQNCVVTVTCGIHKDAVTPAEIETICHASLEMVTECALSLYCARWYTA